MLQEAKGQMVGIKSVKCRTGTEDTPGIFCSSRFGTRKWNIPNHALLTGKFGGEKRGEMWITQKNAVKSKETLVHTQPSPFLQMKQKYGRASKKINWKTQDVFAISRVSTFFFEENWTIHSLHFHSRRAIMRAQILG